MVSSRSTSQMLGSIAGQRSITFNLNTPWSTILLVLVVATLCYVAPKTEGALMVNFQTAWPLWPDCAIVVAALMLVRTKVWAILIPASFVGIVLYDLQAGVPV